jgi:hypothetical protein
MREFRQPQLQFQLYPSFFHCRRIFRFMKASLLPRPDPDSALAAIIVLAVPALQPCPCPMLPAAGNELALATP